MNPLKPRSEFQAVKDIMLQPAPLSDQDIEDLLNQAPMLPAEELPSDDNTTN